MKSRRFHSKWQRLWLQGCPSFFMPNNYSHNYNHHLLNTYCNIHMIKFFIYIDFLILTTILCTRYYYYPSFSTRNLRHRMFKRFPQGHTAWKWQKQDQNPGSVAPLPQLGPGHDHRIDKKEGIWSNYHLLLHHYIFLTNLYLTVAQTGIVSLRPSKDSWIYNSSSNKN